MTRKMDWLSLEQRIRKALRSVESSSDSKSFHAWEALVKIDLILADETGRGEELSKSTKIYLVGATVTSMLEEQEWR